MYAGYIASAFLLPKGTNNNRVVAAGTEDLHGPLGTKARFFLVGLRPGTSYEVGATFRPALQIDPLLPGVDSLRADVPGRPAAGGGRRRRPVRVVCRPGTPGRSTSRASTATSSSRVVERLRRAACRDCRPSGGSSSCYSKTRPAGRGRTRRWTARRSARSRRDRHDDHGVEHGVGRALHAHHARAPSSTRASCPVRGGKFTYTFDPAAVHAKVPLYDIVNNTTGKPQIGRVIHLTFFSEETSPSGRFHDATRVILRGTTLLSARAPLPTSPTYLLTLNSTGQRLGHAGHDRRGVDCATCAEPYAAGTLVTLTAAAAPGSIFVGWTGACSGMGPCTVTMDAARSVNATFQSAPISRRYFAEGAVTGLFDCRFALVNAQEATAHVTMRFLKDGGANACYQLEVPPVSRRTVDARAGARPRARARLRDDRRVRRPGRCRPDDELGCDGLRRALRDRRGRRRHRRVYLYGGLDVRSAPGLLRAGQSERLADDGPGEATWRSNGGVRSSKTYGVAAASRRTIRVNGEDPALAAASFSGVVTSLYSAAPIVVERAMDLNEGGQLFGAGDEAAGVTAPATEWVFAEGATGPFFDFYLVIAQPGRQPVRD